MRPKAILFTFIAISSSCLGAPEEYETVFRSSTFFGNTFNQIKDAKIFGEPSSTSASVGRFNVPYRIEFHDVFNTRNPYSTEIGFDHTKEVAYLLIRKRSLSAGQRLQDGEILPTLVKTARGGEWKRISKDGEENLIFEYAHVYKKFNGDKLVQEETFRAYAYVPNNRTFLFIYTPFVSPNLAELNAGRSFRFSSGEELILSESAGEGESSITYIDGSAPSEVKDNIDSDSPASRQLALDSLNKMLRESKDSGSKLKTYLVLDSELPLLLDSLATKRGNSATELKSKVFKRLQSQDDSTEQLRKESESILEKLKGTPLD